MQRGIDAKPKNNIERCGSDILNRQNALASSHLKTKVAFTLAEMMVVMLIVSIALAAMAPVMTTKMKSDRAREAAGSIWQYAANNSDIYYSTDGAQSVMVGQREVVAENPTSLLVLNTNNADRNHILFKNRDTVLGRLQINGDSLILGNSPLVKSNNTILGIGNLAQNTDGGSNTVIGNGNLPVNTDGGSNTVIGNGNLAVNTDGENNIAIGTSVLAEYEKGNNNIAIGNNAGVKSMVPTYADRPMNNALSDDQPEYSIAIGSGSRIWADYSSFNSRFGPKFARGGIAIGHYATANEGIVDVTSTGTSKNYYNYSSIAIGNNSWAKSGGIAIGSEAVDTTNSPFVYSRTQANGELSIAIGVNAQTDASKSIVLGTNAKVEGNTSGSAMAIGNSANAKGGSTIAIGNYAQATGANNIAIGKNACSEVTGSNKVCIGANSGPKSTDSWARDTVERIFIGGKSNLNGGPAVLEVHNDITKDTRDTGVVINGHLIVKGYIYSRMPINGSSGSYFFNLQNQLGSNEVHLWNSPNAVDMGPLFNHGADNNTRSENWTTRSISSDRRLKYVGKENKDGLSKLRQIKVFNYTFKKDPSKEPRVGVIAQDLQKVFPNAVKKGPDGFLTIRMEDMFYALVNAVKELDVKVTEILKQVQDDRVQIQKDKAEIQALKKENKELKLRLEKLEAKLK